MLLLQDARGEGSFVIGVEHFDGFLHDDWPMIQFFVDEVDRAAGNLHSVGECLLLRLEAGNAGNKDG